MVGRGRGMGVSNRRRTGRLSMRLLFLRRGMGFESLCWGGNWCSVCCMFLWVFGLAGIVK